MKLTEIAKMLNLSVGTVSMALNNSSLVKLETREKVRQFAKMVNYTPSAVARSLVMKKTKTVGIVSVDIFSPYYNQLAHEIQKQLRNHGYLGIVITADNPDEQMKVFHSFLHRRVDGIMAARLCSETTMAIKNEKNPLVIYDETSDIPVDFVVADRYKGGYMATEHLIRLGYREIGFVCAVSEREYRLIAFRAALHDHLIPLRPEWVGQGLGIYRDGYEVMKKMLALPEKPRAVVCLNDVSAIGAMRAVREAGLRVPDDLAMVGFDNIEESEYGYVPLTTIHQPRTEIAQKAVELFLQRLESPLEESYKKIVIDVKLIIRESCGWNKSHTRKEV